MKVFFMGHVTTDSQKLLGAHLPAFYQITFVPEDPKFQLIGGD